MDNCVGGMAVSGPCSLFSFVGWPNGPLSWWNGCFWALQLVFLCPVAKWKTVLVGWLFLGPSASFPLSGGQMDHCEGEMAVSGPRS
jgi:hypothetical protein